MNRLCLSILVFLCSIASATMASPYYCAPDSVGIETIDGKTFVIHKVDPGQTLYSISKRYNVSVDKITAANPGSEMGLRVGQVLKIPKDVSPSTSENSETATQTTETTEATYHTVAAGETLYAISKKYSVSVENIQKWNNLSSNELAEGQKLIVSQVEESIETETVQEELDDAPEDATVFTADTDMENSGEEANEEAISTDEQSSYETDSAEDEGESTPDIVAIMDESDETTTTETTTKGEVTTTETTTEVEEDEYQGMTIAEKIKKQAQQVTYEKTEVNEDSLPSKETVDMGGYNKTFEKGYAVLLENTDADERYLAHHRTLPIGTILQVKNLENGKTVFVRVVGKLEHPNPKVIISLSTKAQVRLRAIFNNIQAFETDFPAEISYIP